MHTARLPNVSRVIPGPMHPPPLGIPTPLERTWDQRYKGWGCPWTYHPWEGHDTRDTPQKGHGTRDSPRKQIDRHLRKHYLLPTIVAGGNKGSFTHNEKFNVIARWVECIPMVLFTHSVKKTKSAADIKGDFEGKCECTITSTVTFSAWVSISVYDPLSRN